MNITEVKFRDASVKIACDDENKAQALAMKVNSKIDQLQAANSNCTTTKLTFLAAITLQDEIDSLQEEIMQLNKANSNKLQETSKGFSYMLEQIAIYVENLANELEKE